MQIKMVLYDPKVPIRERPIQAFFTHPVYALDWATTQLMNASDEAVVWEYHLEETLHWTHILTKGIHRKKAV